MRDDDSWRKRRYQWYQDQLLFVHALNCLDKNQLVELTSSLIFVDPSSFAQGYCIKGAIRARGGALKPTLVVDNDRQCTMYIRTQLPSVPQP